MRKSVHLKRLTIAGALLAVTLAAPTAARADAILIQNFDDVTALAGWTLTNNSTPGGSTAWFQGNDGVFPAQDGAPGSYIAANYLNAGLGGNISNWLILPELTLEDGDTLTFLTRSTGVFDDRLEVRFSGGGSGNVGSTDASVGDFTTLLLTVNPALSGSYRATGLGTPSRSPGSASAPAVSPSGYDVPDTNVNGDYIGIDSVVVNHVPEPATVALVSLGLAGSIARRGRSARSPRKEVC